MNRNRILIGWACIGLGFLIVVLLGSGLVDPPGLRAARTPSDLLAVFAPPLLSALALFGTGLWLIRKPRRR